jgi:16S rRNA (cytidine1402-2'-O)-methyltransferase
MPGTLVLCATPIGNLADASPRLREALASADLIYAEDTRRSRKLLAALGVTASLRSYHVGNEDVRALELRGHLEAGKTVAFVTDAGMPAVADPGLTAVHAAIVADATVTVVPGPSAVTAAVAVSGLPSERFVFEGFLPRKQAARRLRLEEIADEPRTMVLFVAPSRADRDLADLAGVCGLERPVVLVRELTKLHEEVWRGTLGEAARHFEEAIPRGELTAVVGGRPAMEGDFEAATREVAQLVSAGMSFSDAVRRVAVSHGVRRRDLYEASRAGGEVSP